MRKTNVFKERKKETNKQTNKQTRKIKERKIITLGMHGERKKERKKEKKRKRFGFFI